MSNLSSNIPKSSQLDWKQAFIEIRIKKDFCYNKWQAKKEEKVINF